MRCKKPRWFASNPETQKEGNCPLWYERLVWGKDLSTKQTEI